MEHQNQDTAAHRAILRAGLNSVSTLALATAMVASVGLLGFSQAKAATPDSGTQVQEVIVTAQKRAQSLQKVPVAVAVVTAQKLATENSNNLQDLTETLSDVHVLATGGPVASINIRGIGSGVGNPAFDQSVPIFEDDIFHGRSHMIAQSFLDLDRIEVLKGPQSTFFGNNAIGGALNIVTKKPDDHYSGWVRALYGSYGAYALEGAAGGPINDKVAIRIAGTYNGDTGWIRNVVDGSMGPADKNIDGRITAVLKPSANFDATIKVEGGENDIRNATSDSPWQWTNCPPPAGYLTKTINKNCPVALANPTVPLGLYNNQDAVLPGQYADLSTNEDVVTMNYHHDGLTFTSVTGFSTYRFTTHRDNANVGLPEAAANDSPENYSQLSQEFRVASPVGQTIEYMFGVYYQFDTTRENIESSLNSNNATVTSKFPALIPYEPLAFELGYTQREQIESAFGSLSWNISDKLKLNAGLRLTSDEKNFLGTVGYGTGTQVYGGYVPLPTALISVAAPLLAGSVGAPGAYPNARTDRAAMPSVGLQYQVTPVAMAYATASHGFKAGGYNAVDVASVNGASPAYGPEQVNAYEVGLKSKWFDNSLLINVDAFREDYTGLQVNSLSPTGSLLVPFQIEVRNAAASISQGVELDTQWVATENFRVSANITYLDSHYTSFPNASPTTLQVQNKITSQSLSGSPLDFASKWSGSLSADYMVNLPGDFRLTAEVTPIFESPYFNSNGSDDPVMLIKSSLRWDGRITLEQPDKRWAIDLIGKNITNRVIAVAQNASIGGKEEPVNVSLQLRYHW